MFGKLIYSLANRALIRAARAICALILIVCSLPALAAIPATERQVLIDFYSSTHGTAWIHRDNWMGAAGTECTWFGVTCDAAQEHVTGIYLSDNNLVGSLPTSLNQLTALKNFYAFNNQLTGNIPALGGLTALQYFSVYDNQLMGSIPSLDGLTALQEFRVSFNQLTGRIPSLSGLTSLKRYGFDSGGNRLTSHIPTAERQALIDLYNSTNGTTWSHHDHWLGAVDTECTWFGVTCDQGLAHVMKIDLDHNHLSGSLPDSLNQLAALQYFNVRNNQIMGRIPSLSGMTALQDFNVYGNRLTGSIPSLSGLTALQAFIVAQNQLTGSIPSLSGLTALWAFSVSNNQLTGNIPSLNGLTALWLFDASNNQLTGNIPSLSGLRALQGFVVAQNQLTGSIPSLNEVTGLRVFAVNGNQLTGTPPAAPATLQPGKSALCPNDLSTPSPTDNAWNKATGGVWSAKCTKPAH